MDLSGRTFSTRRRSILRSESHLCHSLQRFMATPLVTWVKTLGSWLDASDGDRLQYLELKGPGRRDLQTDYLKLVDGVLLNRIMRQIDPHPQSQRIYRNDSNDEVLRVQNLSILVQHIKVFYQEDLQQLILMTPPNVQLLGRDPLSEEGLQELSKVLLLLLGCAVQSERREEIIAQIQTLDLDTQASVAAQIQEITQNQQNVVSLQWSDLASMSLNELEFLFHTLAGHLKSLAKQRDDNMERMAELSQERERLLSEGPTAHGPRDSRQNLTVQLADSKAKLRRLRQELEEKSEHIQDCQQELQELQTEFKNLQKQNRALMLEARTAQSYRDEVDVLQEKARSVDRLQSEVKAYKERLNSIDFYKGKAEEERLYSQALLETKALLEEQLEAAQVRCDTLHELEVESLLLRSALQDLEMERETDRQRIDELLDINVSLKAELNERAGESEQPRGRRQMLADELPDEECIVKSLSHEVGEATSSQLLRLERENQELRRKQEELRQSCTAADISNSARIASLEQERQKLQTALQRLQSMTDGEEKVRTAEVKSPELLTERSRLKDTVQSCDREVQGLKPENEHLSRALPKQCSQSGAEPRAEDAALEKELLQEQCRAKTRQAEELSQELARAEELQRGLRERVEELEASEEGRLSASEERVSALQVENRELGRARAAAEEDREGLREENRQLRQAVGAQEDLLRQAEVDRAQLQKAQAARAEELESAYQSLRSESQRQAEALERAQARASELEKEVEEAEAEGQRSQKEAAEGRAAVERLERDKEALSEALAQSGKDKRQLEKESRRLRQQAEIWDSSLDESSARLARLEQENRRLAMEAMRTGELLGTVRELQGENTELSRGLAAERGALGSLREELMSEKMRSQELSNQLERLSNKLQRLGPTQEQGLPAHPPGQPSSYELLEVRLDAVLRDALQTNDAHVERLRCQLERAEADNSTLSARLRELTRSSERPQPEGIVVDKKAASGSEARVVGDANWERRGSLQDPISDRLIEVERMNATLLAEKGALSSRNRQLETQLNGLQTQVVTLQKHCISLQQQFSSLQAQNTRLQVENTSLASKNEALVAQGNQQQEQQGTLEVEAKALAKEHEEVRGQLEALTRDHARLAVLHERQEAELEALIRKHAALKGSSKTLEAEQKELEGRYKQLQVEKAEEEELQAALRSRLEALEVETREQQSLNQAHQQLKDQHERVSLAHGDVAKQCEELRAELKALKSQLSAMQLEKARADVEHGVLREQFQVLDQRWTKLSSHCELLSQLKGNLEEENRHLVQQVTTLAGDNRALLEKTVQSKDQFHEEQRQYTDKLNKLRREKQKLVEKIMDQYRVVDPSVPRSRKGNWIADKMKKLIKPRKELSKEQLRSHFVNPTSSLDIPEGIVHLSQLENSGQDPESDRPTSASDGPEMDGIPEQQERILVRTRRKLSSRIYGSDTPRHRFRQRRVGWEEEETEAGNAAGKESEPGSEGKGMTKNLEPTRESHNQVTEVPQEPSSAEDPSRSDPRE